jgi:hypothetical protein
MKKRADCLLDGNQMQKTVLAAVKNDQGLAEEFKLLFDRSLDDPCMAVARARRLLEVMIIDRYVESEKIKMPPAKQLPNLYAAIEKLGEKGDLNVVHQALSHSVRVEGNRAVHYKPELPNYGKQARVTDDVLEAVIGGLCELVCAQYATASDKRVLPISIPRAFAKLYSRYEALAAEFASDGSMNATDIGCVEMLMRSLFSAIQPGDLEVLKSCHSSTALPARLSTDAEDSYVRLRNAGLIKHDKKTLFTPVRSTKVTTTERANLLLALSTPSRRGSGSDAGDLLPLLRESVDLVKNVICDRRLASLLKDLHERGGYTTRVSSGDLRVLRNSLLVANEGRFLQTNPCVKITHLGYYCLGKLLKD